MKIKKNYPFSNLRIALLFFSTIGISNIWSQEKNELGGMFSLGSRSTLSFFDHHGASMGIGMGGQFRIQLTDRVNTEWYLDYLSSETDGVIGRKDLHIGWSVFYYYLKNNATSEKLIQPFFELGHCFDHAFVNEIGSNNFAERWSSAVQLGTGVSFNISPKFDFTSKVQYMIHLGSDISTEIDTHDGHQHIHIHKNEGLDLEGHLLWTFSLNYKIGKLWNR